MSLAKITDHAIQALARMPYQTKGRENMEFLISTLCGPMQDLEDAAYDVLLGYLIDNSVGAQLTTLGGLVKQPRNGVTDDDLYRRYVRAKAAVLNSSGTYPDIIAVCLLVLGDSDVTITLQNSTAATVLVDLGSVTGVTAAVADILIGYLRKTVVATVRLLLTYSLGPDDESLQVGTVANISVSGPAVKPIGTTTFQMVSTFGLYPSGSILIDPGLASQEVCTYTSIDATNIYGISPTTAAHAWLSEILQYDEDTGMGDTADALVGGGYASVLE